MFSPSYRTQPVFKPLAVYFLFQGVLLLLGFLLDEIWKGNAVSAIIQYIGTIVIAGYILICLFLSKKSTKRIKKKEKQNESKGV